MITTTDALDHTTTYHYDNRDNLIGLTDANDNTHVFTFDRADRMKTEARPMGETIVYEYDDAGQLVARTDPVGNRAEYDYDDAGRRVAVRHYAAGQLDTPERTVTFTYDARGQMTGYNDGTLSGSYTFDDLGRKTQETVNYPGFSKTHQQSWHPNGRQASLTAPDGTEYGFSWDDANRMESVTIPGEGVIAYSEYEWQQPSQVDYPGGTTRENTYDGLQRHSTIQVTDETGQVLMDYQYTWNETGNITEKATEHGIYSYGYDDIDRLTQAEYPTFSAEEWTYDPLGNRITDTGTGEAEWQYNDNNELLDSIEYTHKYDDNGSLVAEYHPDGTIYRTFDYNAENRMSSVKDANGEIIAEYLYDPFGRRVKRTVYDPPGTNPETTWYVYSDQGLMSELDDSGNPTEFYLFQPDGLWSTDPILRRSGGSYYYYQTDHLGTPQQLIDGAGAVVHSREMRGFGEMQQTGVEGHWGFPGQIHSPETGLYYNYFRDYDSRTGRYVEYDPIGLRGGLATYAYAINNPVGKLDPTGLFTSRLDYGLAAHFYTGDGESVFITGYCPTYMGDNHIQTHLKLAADAARIAARRYNSGGGSSHFEKTFRFQNTILQPWSFGTGYDNVSVSCDFSKEGCCTKAQCGASAFRRDRFTSPYNLDRLFGGDQDNPYYNLGGTPFNFYIHCGYDFEFSVCE